MIRLQKLQTAFPASEMKSAAVIVIRSQQLCAIHVQTSTGCVGVKVKVSQSSSIQ